jgi:hypothetical protein
MSVQIDQIFTAKAENIWQFLHTAGQGCYIPAYQRPYAWDDENVDRLIDDAINGLNHLEDRSSAISFLGTIIAIHDVKNITVKPVYQAEVAPRVMTLIDGQQRVSTSVMMNVALHHHISAFYRKLEKVPGEAFDWVRQQSQRALAELWTTFALDQTTGMPEVYRYYPRVIRAFDDVWSTKGNQALYNSPIARLVWAYIEHAFAKKTDVFNHKVADDDGVPDPKHEAIVSVFRYMRQQLTALTSKKVGEYDFPDLQQVVRNEAFMTALWAFVPPEPVVRYVTEQSDDKHYDTLSALLRSLVFHRYFNTRMALTIVTTRSEDDAFDMFEALNTTGEPLTAFETFKPKIIEAEGLEQYQDSPAHKNVQRIEQYLDAFKKADERQKATSELLIPFALAETGERLQKDLGDQRRYLRDYFDKLPSMDEKRGVVASLANLSAFVRTAWLPQEDGAQLEGFGTFDDETGFCFQSLRALKHAVAIGALSRFYDEFRRADDTNRVQRKADFAAAIRAATAFSMLWRGGFGGTENIDAVYRAIMREGLPADKILPLAKRPKEELGAVSLHGLKRILWAKLTEKFADRDAWVKAASRVPIYAHSAVVAKFLLLAASDDATLDTVHPGLIIRGTKGLATTIRSDAIVADNHFSVEHIAPQAVKSTGWDEALYDDPQTLNRLGNLTLLPSAANSYVSKRPWKQKSLIYRYFCSETQAEADALYATFAKNGLTVSASGDAVLGKASYMPMCKAIAAYLHDWDVEIVDQRSTRLAELAYDRIVGWLKP